MCICLRKLAIKILSTETRIRKLCFKLFTYTRFKLWWMCIPALCCTFLDLIIFIYLGITLSSTGGYVISNILVHLFYLIICALIFEITPVFTDLFQHDLRDIKEYYLTYFIFSIIICLPVIILKFSVIFIYIPISHSLIFSPTIIQIILTLISIPLIIDLGLIYIAIYIISLCFIGTLMIFLFLGIFFGEGKLNYHQISSEEYSYMFNKLYIDEENLAFTRSSFLYFGYLNKRKVILEKTEDVRCLICLEALNSHELITSLDCGHMFHEQCLELVHNIHYFLNECFVCQQRYDVGADSMNDFTGKNILHREYSWTTKLHYYMKAIPLIATSHALNSTKVWFSILNIGLNLAVIIGVLCVTGITNKQSIRVLSNSLITIIILQQMMFIARLNIRYDSKITLNHFLIDWTDMNCRYNQLQHLEIQRLHEILTFVLYILLIWSYFYIQFDQLPIIELIFLCFISFKIFMDIVVMFSPIQLLFLVATLLFDFLVVLPVTFFYMINKKKSFKQVYLLI